MCIFPFFELLSGENESIKDEKRNTDELVELWLEKYPGDNSNLEDVRAAFGELLERHGPISIKQHLGRCKDKQDAGQYLTQVVEWIQKELTPEENVPRRTIKAGKEG